MIENLIFDLDGTIVNSYPHFVTSFIAACEKNGIDVPYDRETVYKMLKITVPDAYKKLDVEHKTTYEKFYADYVAIYSEHYTEQPGYAETIDLIKRAKAAGKKNFIYTHTGPIAKEVSSAGKSEISNFKKLGTTGTENSSIISTMESADMMAMTAIGRV